MACTKENKYCDDDSKIWIVDCKGKRTVPKFVSAKNANREVYPELNFEFADKEFIVQFENLSDLMACRDTGRSIEIHVTALSRATRVKGSIIHQKIK